MGRSFMRVLPVFMASLYAFGMGMCTVIARRSLGGSQPYLGDPMAYWIVGLLGCAVMLSLGAYERRILELEARIRDRQGQDAETGAAPDDGG